MKCPACQAKLLPVDGEMFCLQCGQTLHTAVPVDNDNLSLEETSDPMLQRAIRDAGNYSTQFKPAPAIDAVQPVERSKSSQAEVMATKAALVKAPARTQAVAVARVNAPAPRKRRSFVSLHALVMAPRALAPENMLMSVLAAAEAPASSGRAIEASARQVDAEQKARLQSQTAGRHTAVRGWLAALAVITAGAGLNIGAGNYLADKVYPGVKVGTVNVGGWSFGELESKLPGLMTPPELTANVDGRLYPLEVSAAATGGRESVERQVKELGRQSPLAATGVVQSMTADPIRPNYVLSDEALDRAVAQLAAKVNRSASDAVITTMDTNVIIIAEKPGVRLDPVGAAAAIKSAYGLAETVTLKTEKVAPKITAEDLAADKTAAEALMAQSPQLTVRTVKHKPTAAQLASWVVFNGPGNGVSVDPAGVAVYVKSLPGRFDRVQATAALVSALNNRKSVQLTASTKRITAAPSPASTAASWPLTTYNYCIQAPSGENNDLAEAMSATLASKDGWALGGRVKYTAAQSGCNFKLHLADAAALKTLDPACELQATCRIHNDLAINTQAWLTVPTAWTSGETAYRSELIGQAVGQWLGFDHASCKTGQAAPAPLSQTTLNISGCSPQWYAVPPELQDTKVLAGFEI